MTMNLSKPERLINLQTGELMEADPGQLMEHKMPAGFVLYSETNAEQLWAVLRALNEKLDYAPRPYLQYPRDAKGALVGRNFHNN